MIAGAVIAQLAEVARVVRALPAVERGRRTLGPKPLLAELRERGKKAAARGPEDRARLRRAIGLVDALCPGKRNCYRRALLEIALDAGGANARFVMGFRDGEALLGHAWLAGREEPQDRYDVRIEL